VSCSGSARFELAVLSRDSGQCHTCGVPKVLRMTQPDLLLDYRDRAQRACLASNPLAVNLSAAKISPSASPLLVSFLFNHIILPSEADFHATSSSSGCSKQQVEECL
jgi:hypothetical protein